VNVKYIPYGSAKIVVNQVTYQNQNGKNAVLPADAIGKEELEMLLKRKLIVKLEFDEFNETGASAGSKNGKQKKKSPKNKSQDSETQNDELPDAETQDDSEPQE
jgi:hypothetical protein